MNWSIFTIRIFLLLTCLKKNDSPVDWTCTEPGVLSNVLTIKPGETIYDACWYPGMQSSDAPSCCFLTCSRDHPVQLWDAYTGQQRAAYLTLDHLEQVKAPLCASFDNQGKEIICGGDGSFHLFPLERPGSSFGQRILTRPFKKSKESALTGLISCLTVEQDLVIAGSFSKSVGVYDKRSFELVHLMLGLPQGVTQVLVENDKIYVKCRKNLDIYCWDFRNSSAPLTSWTIPPFSPSPKLTNQRLSFDIQAGILASGDEVGNLYLWNINDPEPLLKYPAHQDVISAARFHPQWSVLATCSGQRKIPSLQQEEEEEEGVIDNSLKLWLLSNLT